MPAKRKPPNTRPTARQITLPWRSPCCGPALSPAEMHSVECECGLSYFDCALGATATAKQTRGKTALACGWAGFWCYACGRFWAQNSCGSAFAGSMASSDGANQVYDEHTHSVSCCCGAPLYLETNLSS